MTTLETIERTFAIIKPHVIEEKRIGEIISMIESHGFAILAMQLVQFDNEQGEVFYEMHKERPFFGELVGNMTAGPSIILVLAKENAIFDWRELMGPTNPDEAPEGTIREKFGKNISFNAVHGSDSPESAQREISLFFPELA